MALRHWIVADDGNRILWDGKVADDFKRNGYHVVGPYVLEGPTSTTYCRCIMAAHCNPGHKDGECKLRVGGTVNAGGGVCSPRASREKRQP